MNSNDTDSIPLQAARRMAHGRPTHLRVMPPRGIVPIADWADKPAPPRRWLVDGLVPERNVTMLTGNGGDGKSLLLLQLLCATALGRPWLGYSIRQGHAVGIFAEDEPDELHRRVEGIAAAEGFDVADLAEHLTLVSRVGEDNGLIAYGRNGVDGFRECEFLHQVENLAQDTGARLIVLDPLHALFTGNENDREQAFHFIGRLRRLALDADGTVMLCAHPSRAGMATGSGDAGSTGWHNSVRSRLYLTRPEDEPDTRILSAKKANYGPLGSDVRLTWAGGAFAREVQNLGGTLGRIEARNREAAADRAFLACLDAAHTQGRTVTDAANSPRYAPRVFATMGPGKSFPKRALEAAMARLFDAGKIEIGSRVGPDRHPVKCIVRGHDD